VSNTSELGYLSFLLPPEISFGAKYRREKEKKERRVKSIGQVFALAGHGDFFTSEKKVT
jgi:hypothetical protein